MSVWHQTGTITMVVCVSDSMLRDKMTTVRVPEKDYNGIDTRFWTNRG